jgi:hypothetical protein
MGAASERYNANFKKWQAKREAEAIEKIASANRRSRQVAHGAVMRSAGRGRVKFQSRYEAIEVEGLVEAYPVLKYDKPVSRQRELERRTIHDLAANCPELREALRAAYR